MKQNKWQGCIISESLKDPMILNNFEPYKIWITDNNQILDTQDNKGRWHMYWIKNDNIDFNLFKKNMKFNWYCHFWKGNKIMAIFENNIFELDKNDKNTWINAIKFGISQGIPEEQLDFISE